MLLGYFICNVIVKKNKKQRKSKPVPANVAAYLKTKMKKNINEANGTLSLNCIHKNHFELQTLVEEEDWQRK